MQLLGLLGIFAFAATSLIVGVRLAWLAASTRQVPELLIGVSFVMAGFFGLGASLTVAHADLSPTAAMWTTLAGSAVSDVGYGLLAAFVWRVFRPTGAGGRLTFGIFIAGLATGFGVSVAYAEPRVNAGVSPGFWITLAFQIAIYGWATAESLTYWLRMRRRAAIGAADPLLANRFLLWGIGTAAVCGIWIHLGVTRWSATSSILNDSDYLVIATLGFTCAATCWCAFLPPRFYSSWIQRRGEPTA